MDDPHDSFQLGPDQIRNPKLEIRNLKPDTGCVMRLQEIQDARSKISRIPDRHPE